MNITATPFAQSDRKVRKSDVFRPAPIRVGQSPISFSLNYVSAAMKNENPPQCYGWLWRYHDFRVFSSCLHSIRNRNSAAPISAWLLPSVLILSLIAAHFA